ncbi:MAG: phytoene desaturase family protein [Spirochaetota bacterium]
MKKHIAIIGAGPGGLTAAMILAHRGFKVSVFEKDSTVGGRNKAIVLKKGANRYTFDTGPTFLMLKNVLDEVFEEAGTESKKHLKFNKLDPMYRLSFDDVVFEPSSDHKKMEAMIERIYPGQGMGLAKYLAREKVRFDRMYPCLQKEYGSARELLSKEFRGALSHLSIGRSLMDVLRGYFSNEKLALTFTFQAKYLGMSPWECPGAFTIISYIEHAFGVYHTEGGLSAISDAMAKVVKKNGGSIYLHAPVKRIVVKDKAATGIELADGEIVPADDVIINADFGHAMTNLFDDGVLKKHSKKNVAKKDYSCSIFMMYLGVKKRYDMPHHSIVFADDYKGNVADIFKRKVLSKDTSFYVRNAGVTDRTLAPKGHSALYVLVPVANLTGDIDWASVKDEFRDIVLDAIEKKTVMKDLRRNIVCEKIITPDGWRDDYNVYNGATFNLSHKLTQMLFLRPHNRFEEVDRVYLTGGGTHPGSGLPTIYESARISANLISKKYKVPYVSKNTLV